MSTDTLGTALPEEIQRCQELLTQYHAIGPSGALAAMMIESTISSAMKAMMAGDLPEMIATYQALKGYE